MVTQYNVNPSYNEELKRRCPELDGYIKYVEKTRKYHKTGMTYEEAVKKSVDECIEEGILKEFFVKNKAEVISMTIFEYDEEEHMRLEREEQYRKGEEAGEAVGLKLEKPWNWNWRKSWEKWGRKQQIKKSDKKETCKRKSNYTDSRWSRRNRGKGDWADKRNWDGAGIGWRINQAVSAILRSSFIGIWFDILC